jgi:PAS domain-containing protein
MKRASGGTHRGAWLPHLSTPVAAFAFWLMHRANLLGPAPYWVILLLLGASGVCNVVAYTVSSRMAPGPLRMHVRLSVAALTTTVILYSTGWGSVIAMGYVLGTSDVLRTDGNEAWWRGTVWSLGAIVVGQLAVAAGIAPSVLSTSVSHAVAVGNAVCLGIVMYSLGTTTAAAERAKEDVGNEREHFRSLVLHARDVITVLDKSTLTIQYASPAIEPLLGWTPDECVGMSLGDLIGDGAQHDSFALTTALTDAGGTLTVEFDV